MEQKQTCPECHLTFEAPPTEAGVLVCPLCDTVFSTPPPVVADAPAPPPAALVLSARHVLKGCLAVAGLLFVVGGLVYAYRLVTNLEPKAAHATAAPTVSPAESEPPSVIEVLPTTPEPPPSPPPPPPVVLEPKPHRLSASAKPPPLPEVSRRPLSLPERVNRAIDRGVAHLHKNRSGHKEYRNYLGLLGLTFLECGIPAKDPFVQQIAAWLRTRERDLTGTYELSLAILFLDRLNDARDRVLIRTFGQRLLAGQIEGGTWSYSCLANDKRRHLAGRSPSAPLIPELPQIITWRNATPLHNPAARPRSFVYRGDNSNTQFAILGLWVAQRHGVSVRSALLATEQYFRQTQGSDGSWSYHTRLQACRDSMTCAGLMSLAMRYGVINGQGRDIRPDRPMPVNDRAITQGLRFLGRSLDEVVVMDGRILGAEARDPLYYLWSLERMAMIYDLKKVGDKEWYPWAADLLVQSQQRDGSWLAPYPPPVGTCFALLVLKRSNLAHDLQLTVQGQAPSRGAELGGPTIRQGPGATLGPTTAPRGSADMPGTAVRGGTLPPLGPTTTQGIGKRE